MTIGWKNPENSILTFASIQIIQACEEEEKLVDCCNLNESYFAIFMFEDSCYGKIMCYHLNFSF